MPSTPIKQRIRITISYKVKLIEDSKKPGFSRKIAEQKYGIGRNTISTVLVKKQWNFEEFWFWIDKQKSWKFLKISFGRGRSKIFEFLTEKTRMRLPINGPLLIEQAKIIHEKMNRNSKNSFLVIWYPIFVFEITLYLEETWI